jgi:phospholipid/cholesterol/gamma-HCH transport system ATP-binding protein
MPDAALMPYHAPDAAPLVEFRGVCKSFGDKAVLEGVDLSIYEGCITTIIGKSGVGKSVLLKHIIGLLAPDSGDILFRGRSLASMSRDERKALKREFAYMFQHNALFDSLSVFDNVALPLKERTKLSATEIRELVLRKLEELEIGDVADKFTSQISGGMQKRVALARALITSPRIVLFDEPTTGLDPIRKNAVLSMIAHYQKKFGFTAVLVSHDIPDVFYISQRIAILEERQVLFQGEPVELEVVENETVRQFVNSLEDLKDELTGLISRNQAEHRAQHEMDRFAAVGETFSVLLLTLNQMENIKEEVGRLAVQRIVQGLAERLRSTLWPTDVCARWSEKSILAILPRTALEEAGRVRDKVAKALHGEEISHMLPSRGVCHSFSIRAGVAQCRPGAGLADLAAAAQGEEQTIAELTCVREPGRDNEGTPS